MAAEKPSLMDQRRAQFARYKRDVKARGKPFYPYAMVEDTIMSLVVVGVIIGLAVLWKWTSWSPHHDGTHQGLLGPEFTARADPGTTSRATFPVRSASAAALSSYVETTSVESLVRDRITAALAGVPVTTPTCTLSGPRCLNAIPNPAASRIGKTKVQKTASGSRMNSRKRTRVSCTIELFMKPRRRSGFSSVRAISSVIGNGIRSLIAQSPSRKRHEHILESRRCRSRLWRRKTRDIHGIDEVARCSHRDHVAVIHDCHPVA